MEPIGSVVVLILILLVIAVPILAISAFVRVSSLQKSVDQLPQLIARIYYLEQRLRSLDQRLANLAESGEARGPGAAVEPALSPAPATTPTPPVSSPVSEPPATPHIEPPTPHRQPVPQVSTTHSPEQPSVAARSTSPPAKNEDDVERTIAGRWFNYVGILAISLAVAFFLKYAFDNNWIGPGARVTIGLAAGGLMYPLSQWVFNRGYRYYSEGIAGLGAAILYLSVWAGWHYYGIFSQAYAFPLMIVITVVTVSVALGRDSERIAAIALAGGLLTPVLVSTGQNEEIALFGYLVVLSGGMLVIAWIRKWQSIAPLLFAGTLVYFWGWYADFYSTGELGVTLFFATAFFLLFAALPVARSLVEGRLSSVDAGIVVTNAFQYFIALRMMLWPEQRWALTFATLWLAGTHLVVERAVARKAAGAGHGARRLYAALALTFATLAIPIRLEGKWITIAFAVEGVLLIENGLRIRSLALRTAGFVLFAVVAIRLGIFVIMAPVPATFLLNERFLRLAVCAGCWLAAFLLARQSDCELAEAETKLFYLLEVAANFCLLLALSMDVWDLFGRTGGLAIDREHAQQLALSLLWVGYALVLLVAGAIRKSASVRWQGLALLGVAIFKAFFFDLSFLTRFYRIISFFVLGLVLLLVSFFYQKRSKMRLKPNQS